MEDLVWIPRWVVDADERLDVSRRRFVGGALDDFVPGILEALRECLELCGPFDLPADGRKVIRGPTLDEEALVVTAHSQRKPGISAPIDHLKAENLGPEILPCREVAHLEDQVPQLLHRNHLLRLRADHSTEAASGYGES